jgi:ribonuclease-3
VNRRLAAVVDLEARLGYVFKDRALLERALTHASADHRGRGLEHNQTLEFLGDRVLGLLAAEALLNLNPGSREGELSRRLVTVISGAACADVARGIGLGPALRLAGSTTQQGGRENERILGDAMEALMAAAYLDGGLVAARTVFDHVWATRLATAAANEGREAKTELQEWAMAQGLPLPTYVLVDRSGPDHAPVFTVTAAVQGYAPAEATGTSLRAAEKAAAAALLSRERGSQ